MTEWIPHSHIIGNIYVGDHNGSRDGKFIFEKGIKFIINCTQDFPNCFEGYANQGITYYNIPLPDVGHPDNVQRMLEHCRTVIPMIKKHDKDNNQGVLIHCYYGASRSASVCAAYLIAEYGYTMQNAIRFIKKQRSIAFGCYNFLPVFHAISGNDGSEAVEITPGVWVGGYLDALIGHFMFEKKIKLIVNFVDNFPNVFEGSIRYINVTNGMDLHKLLQEIDQNKPVFIHGFDPILPFHQLLFQYAFHLSKTN